MSRRRRVRRSVKAGMPAGSLVYLGDRAGEKVSLQVIDYDRDNLRELPAESLEGCLARKESPTVTWINLEGLDNPELLEKLGKGFGIHPLVLEDVLNVETRPKLEDYEGYFFLVVKMLHWDDATVTISSEQVSMILGPHYLITFQERKGDVFEPVRQRIRAGRQRLRTMGPDYLMYALLDAIVDSYFVILEKLDDRIESLDQQLMQASGDAGLGEIHRMKRETIDLRRAVWPLREVLAGLGRSESPLIQQETRVFLRDVQDHTVQVVETVETFRDLVSGLIDLYMTNQNNRMNDVMKVLTVIATIFIPLTLVAGIYGMNFQHMPELSWRYGYPLVMLVMAGIGVGMVVAFKRRGWF